ncbi:MAG: hypothetical protein K2N87_10695 [Eubacterium sp.]|nr:hypothetical protein [Eubacterium sp.]
MFGNFEFRLNSKRVDYKFLIKRKITRIIGNSASGKSELCRLIEAAKNPATKIQISCPYTVNVLTDAEFRVVNYMLSKLDEKFTNHNSRAYESKCREFLSTYDQTLFFIDETFQNVNTHDFSTFCKYTDAFFVIFNRAPLNHLPYSFTEIYKMKESGKFHTIEPLYDSYSFAAFDDSVQIVTEDSHSAFQFLNSFQKNVISANGKSAILFKLTNEQCIFADGSAFGSEIESILHFIKENDLHIILFLPESFEYLLLKHLITDKTVNQILNNLYANINGLYFSWERFFTELLTKYTSHMKNCYSKSNICKCYTNPCCIYERSVCNLKHCNDKYHMLFSKYLIDKGLSH